MNWTAGTPGLAYRISVWARSAGSSVNTNLLDRTLDFAATAVAGLELTGLTANRAAPQPAGTTVTFTATATGGTGPYQYKWWVFDGTDYRPVGGWTSSATFAWTPATGNAAYRIGVWVRSAGSSVDSYENGAVGTVAFPIAAAGGGGGGGQALQLTGLSANVASPQPAGTTVTFMATATGGTGPYQYKWWVFDGTDYRPVQDWTTSATYAWTPTTGNAAYRIGVWVRSAGSSADIYDNGAANGTIGFPIQ